MNDLFDDDTDETYLSVGLAAAESRATRERFRKLGFHQAYDTAKEDLLQEGFEAGYKETFALAKEMGILLGKAVVMHNKANAATATSGSGEGRKLESTTTSCSGTTAANVLDRKTKLLIRERLTAPDLKTSDLRELKKQMEEALF